MALELSVKTGKCSFLEEKLSNKNKTNKEKQQAQVQLRHFRNIVLATADFKLGVCKKCIMRVNNTDMHWDLTAISTLAEE